MVGTSVFFGISNAVDNSGTKLGVQVNYAGAFYQDSGDVFAFHRPVFPARTYVDLVFAKEPILGYGFNVRISNLFDSRAIRFKDYPTGERRVQFGITHKFL